MSVRPRPLSRGWPPVFLAVPLLALAAVIAWSILAAPDPESPAAPAAPKLSTPRVGSPDIAVPTPSLAAPNIKPPGVSIPTPSLPSIASGNGGHSPPRSAPAGPEYRTELTHDHHYHLIWMLDLPFLLLALAGLALLYPFARLPRRGQRVFGAVVATTLTALAVAAFAAGINPLPGPGTYKREPAEIERSDNVIVKHIRVDHFHEPIYLVVPWLLLGLGLAALAVPGARVAVRSTPKAQAAEGAVT